MDGKTLAVDVVKGAIAGAVGTKALEWTVKSVWRAESDAARTREQDARQGQYSSEVAAEKMAHVAGEDLTEHEREEGGEILHWGLGVTGGVAYALARRRWPAVSKGQGLAYGAGFFLAVDEGVNTVFGFTPPPWKFPWLAHARGLTGHLAYGAATELTLDVLDRFVPPNRGVGT